MAYSSVISSKGQVTVPLEIRKRLGLKEGDRLEFLIEGDRTVIRPARAADNPFLHYAGALGGFTNAAEVNAWVADLRDE
jgi:antitoxin PrlF